MDRKLKKKSGLTQQVLGNIPPTSNSMTELEDQSFAGKNKKHITSGQLKIGKSNTGAAHQQHTGVMPGQLQQHFEDF